MNIWFEQGMGDLSCLVVLPGRSKVELVQPGPLMQQASVAVLWFSPIFLSWCLIFTWKSADHGGLWEGTMDSCIPGRVRRLNTRIRYKLPRVRFVRGRGFVAGRSTFVSRFVDLVVTCMHLGINYPNDKWHGCGMKVCHKALFTTKVVIKKTNQKNWNLPSKKKIDILEN